MLNNIFELEMYTTVLKRIKIIFLQKQELNVAKSKILKVAQIEASLIIVQRRQKYCPVQDKPE